MKKHLMIAGLLLMLADRAMAQEKALMPSTTNLINQVDNAKTMDRQQLITNYLQAIANNVTSDSKSVTLKASIFALNPKDSAAKFKDDYYLSHNFQRNTQFMIGGGLDKSNNFNSITSGLTYDILNYRDASMVNTYQKLLKENPNIGKIETAVLKIQDDLENAYYKTKKGVVLQLIIAQVNEAIKVKSVKDLTVNVVNATSLLGQQSAMTQDKEIEKNLRALVGEVEDEIKSKKRNPAPADYLAESITYAYYGKPVDAALTDYILYVAKNGSTPKTLSPEVNSYEFSELVAQINDEIKTQQKELMGADMVAVYSYLEKQYKAAVAEIANRAMLAASYAYQYASSGVKDIHSFSLEYMVGLGKKTGNHVWSLSITGADSLSTDTSVKSRSLKRNILDFQVGINRVFFTDKSSTSLLEANLALEGDAITANKLANEKWTKGTIDLTLQGRPSAKSPWFKLVLKTDKKANILGLFNITVNLDNSSNKGS